MKNNANFEQSDRFKMIVRDSYEDDAYYGLDDFDCRYIKILQAKFGCLNSFHTIPDRVKMEMPQYYWNPVKQKYILDEDNPKTVQLNRLEYLVVSYSSVD